MAAGIAVKRNGRHLPGDLVSGLTELVARSGWYLLDVWLEGGNVIVDVRGLGAFPVAKYDGNNLMVQMRQEVKDLADVIVLHAIWRWQKQRGALQQGTSGRAG